MTTPSAPPTPAVDSTGIARLRAALEAEHAAIFAYGRIGVLLDDAGKAEARAAEVAHRARRDTMVVRLDELSASPAPANPGYGLPFDVTDLAGARRLAVHVEEGVAVTWRAVLEVVEAQQRQVALEAYTDAAIRAMRWRTLDGITPAITPFPGRPG